MKLLNFDRNAKTKKGQARNVMTGILYLAPSTESGINVCPFASAGCAKACLYTSGHGRYQRTKNARINKTKALFENKAAFLATLEKEISLAVKRSVKAGMQLAIRFNGTSDLSVETWGLIEKFPHVQFYDYTKNPFRMKTWLKGGMAPNYHLTFSLSESNEDVAREILALGGNVAVVFHTYDPAAFPATHWGFPVVNGERDDLRFMDEKNVIVGLKMKGRAIHDKTGFVQPLAPEPVKLAA